MTNIASHPLLAQCHALCVAIEGIAPGPAQTAVAVQASDLLGALDAHLQRQDPIREGHRLLGELRTQLQNLEALIPVAGAPPVTLNDQIHFKLTPYGAQLDRPDYVSIDSAGFSCMQLWDFMNVYGPHLFNGAVSPVIEHNTFTTSKPK